MESGHARDPGARLRDPLLSARRPPAPPRRIDPRLPVLHALAERRVALRPGVPRTLPVLRQRRRVQDLRRHGHDRAAAAGLLRGPPDRLRVAPAALGRRRRRPRLRPARAAVAALRLLFPIHPRGPLFTRLHFRDDPRVPALPGNRPGAVADRLRRLLRPGRRHEGERLHDGRPLRRVRSLDPRRARDLRRRGPGRGRRPWPGCACTWRRW